MTNRLRQLAMKEPQQASLGQFSLCEMAVISIPASGDEVRKEGIAGTSGLSTWWAAITGARCFTEYQTASNGQVLIV